MMNKMLSLMGALALVACGQNHTASQVAASSAQSDVNVRGPYDLSFDAHTFMQNQGKAFKLEIDHHTVRACKVGQEYRTSKLKGNEYLVQIRPLMVTMEACFPEMIRDIELGTTIEIPAQGSFSYVTVHIERTDESAATKVEIKSEAGVTVTTHSAFETIAEYNMSQYQGKAFSALVDYTKTRGCYASIGHSASDLGKGEYFVKIEPLMVPAVVCTPAMHRDLQLGAKIDVPAAEGLSFARILIKKNMGLPQSVKGAVVGSTPVVESDELVTDAEVKVQKVAAWLDRMPTIGTPEGDRTHAVVTFTAISSGCTSADSFAGKFVAQQDAQTLVIKRTVKDYCRAVSHPVTLELTIHGGYTMGAKVLVNGVEFKDVTEQVVF